jgi:hypothetical protein
MYLPPGHLHSSTHQSIVRTSCHQLEVQVWLGRLVLPEPLGKQRTFHGYQSCSAPDSLLVLARLLLLPVAKLVALLAAGSLERQCRWAGPLLVVLNVLCCPFELANFAIR